MIPAEGDMGYWTVKPEPRRAFARPHRARISVALVATGHVHRSHDRHLGGDTVCLGAVVGLCRRAGAAAGDGRAKAASAPSSTDFDGSEVEVEINDVEGSILYRIDDVIHEVYPPREAA